MSSSIVTKILGDNGGDPFTQDYVSSIGLRGAALVDAIILNGVQHGDNGGSPTDILTLNDEYIESVNISSGALIDNLAFTTNKGRSIGTGGDGGDQKTVLSGIRIIAIGGRSGRFLDQIALTYVDGYVPSTIVATQAKFILSYTPPNTTIESYDSRTAIASNSYENITSHMLSQTYNASVEAEYGAKVAASTSIQFVNSSLTTIQSSLQTVLENSKKTITAVGANQVGVLLVEGSMMKDADGNHWMYATGDCTNFAIINLDQWANMLNHYDLTGTLDSQLGELSGYRTNLNGCVFYQQ